MAITQADDHVRADGPSWAELGAIGLAVVATSVGHYYTSTGLLALHELFTRLYYLPITYAALYLGWRGGLAAAALSAISYIPHIFTAWHHMPDYAMNQYAEIIVFFLVGSVTGVLADVGRRQRRALEAATMQLRESFEQIKRADRLSAIGQLSASLAHEIRNPLASIDGAANLLEQPALDQEIRSKSLAVIRKECRRLNRLLTDLLDFARPRRPEFHAVDLAGVVDSVIALVAHTAAQSRIQVRKNFPAGLPPVECDAEQIKQVLLNLTINAIQAMPEPGEIEIAAAPAPGGVSIVVRDQGRGVDRAEMEKIFEPFFTTKANGTGLGLSVAQQIVAQHGGALAAEPNDGGGMAFSVTLPLRHGRAG
jgi:signal transduction histidine kinase